MTQREAFEAWYVKAYHHASLEQVENGCYLNLGAGMAWDAWTAAQAQAAVEPVNEWSEAVMEQLCAHSMDAPISDSPTVILAKIIHMAVMQATDPAINGAAGVSVEPSYKAKPYSSLPTVVVSAQVDYYSRDQLNTAIAAARVQALEEAAKICDVTPVQPFRPSIEAAWAIRKLIGGSK